MARDQVTMRLDPRVKGRIAQLVNERKYPTARRSTAGGTGPHLDGSRDGHRQRAVDVRFERCRAVG